MFIAGLEDGLFPHSRSATDPAQLEEERRLCYVAMTRAERFLYVTHAMKRRVYGEELASRSQSQFLNEMPLELMEDLSARQLLGSHSRAAQPRLITNTVSIDAETQAALRLRATDRSGHRTRESTTTPARLTTVSTQSPNSSNSARRNSAIPAGSFQSTREKAEQEKFNRRHNRSPKSKVQRAKAESRS